ncbi:MAG: AAA family ATPase [Catenulispora sp.]|nr:AAA family ATPase [Catenulispora sp.]
MEPTAVLVAGALKAAADAGAAEVGKKAGAAAAEHARGLLERLHLLRKKAAGGDPDADPAADPGAGPGTGPDADPDAHHDAELDAVAIARRAAEDPETARQLQQLLDEARAAGLIPAAQVAAPPPAPAPRMFVNRVTEQADLTGAAPSGIVVVAGRSGIGKTTLVRKWLADQASAQRYDLRILVDVPRSAGVGQIAEELLRRVGVDTSVSRSASEWVAHWHSVMRGQRYCVVLDDVTQPGQVRELIPHEAGSLLVAIGSEPLAELAAEGAEFVEVLPFATDAGVELVERLIGAARAHAEPEAVEEVVGACDGIPAVLALAAGILRGQRDWAVADLADRLADGSRRLPLLRSRGRAVVDLVFDAGYAELDADTARLYRALGHLGADEFQPEVLGAFAGLPEPAVAAALETLLAKYLVQERAWPETGYRVGEMQRNHAREVAQRAGEFGADERAAARRRVRELLVGAVQAADAAASPGKPLRYPELTELKNTARFASAAEGLRWVDAHRAHLLTCAESADDDAALRIAGSMWPYVTNFRRWYDGAWLYRHAAEVARRTGYAEAEARNLCCLSRCLLEIGDKAGARAAMVRATEIADGTALRLQASVTEFVGLVALAEGSYEDAHALFLECGRLHRSMRAADEPMHRGEILAAQMAGRALRWAGQFERAVELLAEAVRIVPPQEQRLGARLRMDLAEALLYAARGREAVPFLEEALPLLDAQLMAEDRFNAEVMLRTARASR